jgi:cysteine desulfurase
MAMGVSPEDARGSVRLSLGCSTTAEEVDTAAAALIAAVEHLRRAEVAAARP